MHEETGEFVDAGESFMQAVASYNHPVDHQDTPRYIVMSHFLGPEMHHKAQNYHVALESYKQAIKIYGKMIKILEMLLKEKARVGQKKI